MGQIFDLLRKWSHVLLFVVLEVVSGLLLFHFNHYQGSVYLTAANGVTARVEGGYTEVEAFFHLRENNDSLTAQNVRLMKENEILRQSLAEYKHSPNYTESVMRERLAAFQQVQALVVSNSVRSGHNYFVINRGTADGIRPEMGVVGGEGVVGIVYLTSEHHSLVLPLINPQSSVSCRIRGMDYFGRLQWQGGDVRYSRLDDIPRYAKPRVGMVVETSGYSSVFPPGLFVGRVTDVGNSKDGQSYSLGVKLGSNFAALRNVSVLTTPFKAEIDTLKAHAVTTEAK